VKDGTTQVFFDPLSAKFSEAKTVGKSPFPLSRFTLTSVGGLESSSAVLIGGTAHTAHDGGKVTGAQLGAGAGAGVGGVNQSNPIPINLHVVDFLTMSWSTPKASPLGATATGPSNRFFHTSVSLRSPYKVNNKGLGTSASKASIGSVGSVGAVEGGPDGGVLEGEGAPAASARKKGAAGLWAGGEEGGDGEETTVVVFGGISTSTSTSTSTNARGDGGGVGVCGGESYALDRGGAWRKLEVEGGGEARFNHVAVGTEGGERMIVLGGAGSECGSEGG